MKVERELAGIMLPFIAGTLTAVYFIGFFCKENHHFISVPILVGVTAGIALLTHPAHSKWKDRSVWAIIIFTMFCCGINTGVTGSIIGSYHADYFKTDIAFLLGEAIDSIPFRHDDTSAIIKALLIGERSSIPRDITESFRTSGASHILALSGFHLGIIYGMVSKMLSIFGRSPTSLKIRSFLTVVSCTIYTFATGAGPSIVRALLFVMLREYAKISGRSCSMESLLFGAIFIQLTLSPLSVCSVGFQLSYAAIAGITFIFPWLKSFWPEGNDMKSPLRLIWNSTALSISCQITTGPIAWLYFHTFPRHFLLTNIIAIPLAGVIIPLAAITLLLNITGICPQMLIRATETLVQALSAALGIISSM